MVFSNRTEAGTKLARALKGFSTDRMILLALPRGGVPVADACAVELHVPFDILMVRKLATPGQPELAMGAVGPGTLVLNEEIIRLLHIPKATIDRIASKEMRELQNQMYRLRGDHPFPNLRRKTVVIVDVGLATGSTAHAAVQTVRLMQPEKLILAVPVCAPDSANTLRPLVDDLICLESPPDFVSVSDWYEDFRPVRDTEVIERLSHSKHLEPMSP